MPTNSDRKGTAQTVRVYRFRDSLALSFVVSNGATGEESTETVYVPAAMAEALAFSIGGFLADLKAHESYSGSEFRSRTVTPDGRSMGDV